MLVVAALGGNALLRRGEALESNVAKRNAKVAGEALAVVAREHQLVVTHGNGPQIGLLALQNEAYQDVRGYPLDVLGAESEGMIGYVLEQELGNALPDSQIASLLTQIVVDARDPAFARPTKPIGPTYTFTAAQRLASKRGWAIAPDGCDASGNERWRRVVASPVPRAIVELPTIELLLAHKVLVICAGGGGIPVVVDAHGFRHGVEAVVDKDLTTALLAEELGADLLVLLTDVAAVEADWGTPDARPLHETTVRELKEYQFAPGSMGPKVAAASSFVTNTGNPAAIGALADAAAVVNGTAGTIIRRES